MHRFTQSTLYRDLWLDFLHPIFQLGQDRQTLILPPDKTLLITGEESYAVVPRVRIYGYGRPHPQTSIFDVQQ